MSDPKHELLREDELRAKLLHAEQQAIALRQKLDETKIVMMRMLPDWQASSTEAALEVYRVLLS